MLIVLDTNIVVSDPAFRNGASAILLDYAHRTESRILLSDLVLDEFLGHRIRMLHEIWDEYVEATRKVRNLFPDAPDVPPPPEFESTAKGQVAALRKILRVLDPDVLAVTEGQLREAVNRGVRRIPPCHRSGEEIRDAIIWLQVLAVVRENTATPVAFISGNTREFATKDGDLLPSLAAEVATGRLVYYTSLDTFAKQHATPIKFITSEWIEKHIASNDVFAAAEQSLLSVVEQAAFYRGDYWDVRNVLIESHWLTLSDFYVYEMEDGTLRVLAYWDGSLDCRIEGGSGHRYDYDYTSDGTGAESLDVEITITTEAVVRGQALQSWKIGDIYR